LSASATVTFLELTQNPRTELRELRQLREENNKLKRLVVDLSLDPHIRRRSSRKSSEASHALLAPEASF
jgi:hypothetical protein